MVAEEGSPLARRRLELRIDVVGIGACGQEAVDEAVQSNRGGPVQRRTGTARDAITLGQGGVDKVPPTKRCEVADQILAVFPLAQNVGVASEETGDHRVGIRPCVTRSIKVTHYP